MTILDALTNKLSRTQLFALGGAFGLTVVFVPMLFPTSFAAKLIMLGCSLYLLNVGTKYVIDLIHLPFKRTSR